jgi:RNA polymerase sigma-70 factor, ECF subfamily
MRNPDSARSVPRPVTDRTEIRARDAALVAAFRSGDDQAFEEFVRLHRRRLFVIALRRVGSVEVAEDAVQVALSKAYRHLAQLDEGVDVGAWLATVVQNAALDQARSETRQRRLADRAYAAAPERDDRRGAGRQGDRGLSRMEQLELGKVLHDGIRALPDPYHRPMVLYYLHGLPVEEVAAVLSLNVNTVKSHLSRGRGTLRRKLGAKLGRGGYL